MIIDDSNMTIPLLSKLSDVPNATIRDNVKILVKMLKDIGVYDHG